MEGRFVPIARASAALKIHKRYAGCESRVPCGGAKFLPGSKENVSNKYERILHVIVSKTMKKLAQAIHLVDIHRGKDYGLGALTPILDMSLNPVILTLALPSAL